MKFIEYLAVAMIVLFFGLMGYNAYEKSKPVYSAEEKTIITKIDKDYKEYEVKCIEDLSRFLTHYFFFGDKLNSTNCDRFMKLHQIREYNCFRAYSDEKWL